MKVIVLLFRSSCCYFMMVFLETLFIYIYKEINPELGPKSPNEKHATLSSEMPSVGSMRLRGHACLHSSIQDCLFNLLEKRSYIQTYIHVYMHVYIQTCICVHIFNKNLNQLKVFIY